MTEWLFDYKKEFQRRERLLLSVRKDEETQKALKMHYKENPIDLFDDWFVTIDPRNAFGEKPTFMPFLLWPRQKEMINWFLERLRNNESGLVEKSRDCGATWIFCGLSVWLWLYYDDTAIGWGSRKMDLVDRRGDPKCIFEKIRALINNLPSFLLPKGYSEKKYDSFMKIINPENYSSIVGEAGSNIGRGGRTLVYFKDESAHYEGNAEAIEAALSENTNIQIDFSSVNGANNIFYRKRNSGMPVFIMDWRDDPRKTQEMKKDTIY